MKISDDELLKKVSGGVLPAGWEEEADDMIAEFHSRDAYELKELSHVDKDAEGMINHRQKNLWQRRHQQAFRRGSRFDLQLHPRALLNKADFKKRGSHDNS